MYYTNTCQGPHAKSRDIVLTYGQAFIIVPKNFTAKHRFGLKPVSVKFAQN
jgi:hypothetical protein